MTLAKMRAGDTGVILAVPPTFFKLPFTAGERVRVIDTRGEAVLVEICGLRLAISLAVAGEMILSAYYE